ncbi:hypothetical protein V7S43_002041 [Phytophthora oleae]|uniref:Uncharacterized protein n=1 Tax=Phytophthora oleae TaxID=2107226 RepID=A0ABD3G2P8_9STRA
MLRMEAENLEFTLQRLQEIKGKRSRTKDNQSSDNKSGGVWREACGRQLEQRLRAERENLHVRKNYEREAHVANRLENLLYKRPARWEMEYPETRSGFYTRRIEIPAGYMNQTAALIFDELSASINAFIVQ